MDLKNYNNKYRSYSESASQKACPVGPPKIETGLAASKLVSSYRCSV